MEDSETSSMLAEAERLEKFPKLLCMDHLTELVAKDEHNLCCIVVTSSLCPHSEAFLSKAQERLIFTDADGHQRRNVRFFHVPITTEDDADIGYLVDRDVTFTATRRAPNAVEKKAMQQEAMQNLFELLSALGVSSTPCAFFYLLGKPLTATNEGSTTAVPDGSVRGDGKGSFLAQGSNVQKYQQWLFNAVVRRNELMKEHDDRIKEEARQAKKEARGQRRLLRRQEEGEEEEDEEEEY